MARLAKAAQSSGIVATTTPLSADRQRILSAQLHLARLRTSKKPHPARLTRCRSGDAYIAGSNPRQPYVPSAAAAATRRQGGRRHAIACSRRPRYVEKLATPTSHRRPHRRHRSIKAPRRHELSSEFTVHYACCPRQSRISPSTNSRSRRQNSSWPVQHHAGRTCKLRLSHPLLSTCIVFSGTRGLHSRGKIITPLRTHRSEIRTHYPATSKRDRITAEAWIQRAARIAHSEICQRSHRAHRLRARDDKKSTSALE